MCSIQYPDKLIKGIPNNDFVSSEGDPKAHLFYFKENPDRQDEYLEQSINWDDDENALEFTLNQKKENGELQFRVGVSSIDRLELNRINKTPGVDNRISYERQSLKGNNYHGNILLLKSTSQPKMKMIAAGIALLASKVISTNT